MTAFNEIQNIYTQYFTAAQNAAQNRKPTDGLFGIGKKAADDPCHTQFIESLQAALQEFEQKKPQSDEVREILSYIYQIPQTHREPVSVYWMLIAAHGTTAHLIPLLTQTDAAALQKEYGISYRKWQRMPVQNDVYKALNDQTKQK